MIYYLKVSVLNLDPKRQLFHNRSARCRKEVQRFYLISDRAVTHVEYFLQFGPFSLKSNDLIAKALNGIVRLSFSDFQITESVSQIDNNVFITARYCLPRFTSLMS
jgi:hypothetical protein